MKRAQRKAYEFLFNELIKKVLSSGEDLESLADHVPAMRVAAAKTRALSLKAEQKYRLRDELVPPHLASALIAGLTEEIDADGRTDALGWLPPELSGVFTRANKLSNEFESKPLNVHNRTFISDIKEFDIRMYDRIELPKTNIMATIGPASFNQTKVSAERPRTDRIEEMALAGMNLIRINLAHVQDDNDRENIRLLINRAEEITSRTRCPLGISVDLAGPKFRPDKLLPRRGVNLPGCVLTAEALTDKDIHDLSWLFDKRQGIARAGQIDYVSVSSVKSAAEIRNLKANLHMLHQQHVKVIAKIENTEAVALQNNYKEFDAILEAADGIMVTRGDLGKEIGIINVPEVQRQLIKRAHNARKPSIVATQMLETITLNHFPTRAEVTDVFNAITEGADALMLSEETSKGIDPPGVVRMMASIARRTENYVVPKQEDFYADLGDDFTRAIGRSIVEWAARIEAKLIIVYTNSGYTAKVISHYRPKQPIVAITHTYDAIMELNLYWGIYSTLINYVPSSAEEAKQVASAVIERQRLASTGDTIIMTRMDKLGIPEFRPPDIIHVFKYEPLSLMR
jgi:pyruvate kinase